MYLAYIVIYPMTILLSQWNELFYYTMLFFSILKSPVENKNILP